MKHTIICWDCSFRNFYHTIDGIISQDYNKDNYEIIYVEQRSKVIADEFNHLQGLKSLWDRYMELKDEYNIKVIYLNDSPEILYHLGRAVNKGIEQSEGEIISVMDGDLLVPPDFLNKLEKYHLENGPIVVNLKRYMCRKPVGVSEANWVDQEISYDLCLKVCEGIREKIPPTVTNKGPLVSASKDSWLMVQGYDEHIVWSTGLSKLGKDVTTRLEILLQRESRALPESYCVHPWHMQGFKRGTLNSQRYLDVQERLIDWSRTNNDFTVTKRKKKTDEIYRENAELIKKIHKSKMKQPGSSGIAIKSIRYFVEGILGKLYRIAKKIIRY